VTARSSCKWNMGEVPAEMQTDQQLLDDFSLGGAAAIDILMSRYQGFLRHQCRRFSGGSLDDAKDLFSLVLIKVYTEHPDQLRKVRHLGAWLRRIAQNKAIDLQRERMAAERRDQGLLYLCESLGELCCSPEEALLNSELLKHMQYAFDALPLRLRLAAHMRFVEDASYESISSQLEITQVNARKRVQEARKRLTTSLRRYVFEEGCAEPSVLSGEATGMEYSQS
jgi:RNA polymerase sigma factor (sigma-70 family)